VYQSVFRGRVMQSTVTYDPWKPSKPLLVSALAGTAAEKRRIYDDGDSPTVLRYPPGITMIIDKTYVSQPHETELS
jgi:hypothetical protein